MTEQQEQIWSYLQKHAVGYAKAVHVYDLAEGLNREHFGTNDDMLRMEIRSMLIDERLPIGTCQKGVFIITTEDERERAIKWIDRNVSAKIDALRNINLFDAP